MRRFLHSLWMAAVLATPVAAAQQPAAAGSRDLCAGHRSPRVMCAPGNGRRTPGGGEKTSHAGWPAVTGILWIVRPGAHGQTDNGTVLNDELLGSHGNDRLGGGPGADILWGDQLPTGNDGWQHDALDGGPGNDWIYSSHGHNDISGGAGNDHIWGHYGHGTIDCGPGHDVVHAKHHPTYALRNCETVLHH